MSQPSCLFEKHAGFSSFALWISWSFWGFVNKHSRCFYLSPLLLLVSLLATRVFGNSMFCLFFLGILSGYRINSRIFFKICIICSWFLPLLQSCNVYLSLWLFLDKRTRTNGLSSLSIAVRSVLLKFWQIIGWIITSYLACVVSFSCSCHLFLLNPMQIGLICLFHG